MSTLDELYALAKVLPKNTPEQDLEMKVSWAAGQCALSDRKGRPIEYWEKVARRVLRKKGGA